MRYARDPQFVRNAIDNEIITATKYKSTVISAKYSGNNRELQKKIASIDASQMNDWEKKQRMQSLITLSENNGKSNIHKRQRSRSVEKNVEKEIERENGWVDAEKES
jgi:hypothetical protein